MEMLKRKEIWLTVIYMLYKTVAVAVSVHVLKTICIEWESVGALNFPFGFQYQTKQNSKHIGKECKIMFILTLSISAAKRTKTSLLQK